MSADVWTVTASNGAQRHADSRSEAEAIKADMEDLGLECQVQPPGAAGDTQQVELIETDEQHVDELDDADLAELPERSVGEDPLNWVPSDFIDNIDGTPAINRKGFEVLSHFYDISVYSDIQVGPEETDHEFCRVKARAVTPDGRECEAFGSAHTDRDDDLELLLELADTRARKRALSIATGVGAVAVEELKSESASA